MGRKIVKLDLSLGLRTVYNIGHIRCENSKYLVILFDYFRENESVTLSQNIEVRPVIAPQVSAHSTANNTISVEVGNNFTLSCGYKIRGDPKPSIIWTKDGKTLQNTITVPDTAGDYFQYHTVLTNR